MPRKNPSQLTKCRICGCYMDPSLEGRERTLRIDGIATGDVQDPKAVSGDDETICVDCEDIEPAAQPPCARGWLSTGDDQVQSPLEQTMQKFEPGEPVKVLSSGGTHWVAGTYCRRSVASHLVDNHGVLLWYPDSAVKHYKPISDEELQSNALKNAGTIRNLLLAAMERLLLPAHRAPVTIEEGTGILSIGSELTIDPAPVENVSILGSIEVPGWEVNGWLTVHNYPHEPDDVEAQCQGQARTPEQAAAIALRALWQMHCDAYWDNLAQRDLDQGMFEGVPDD